MTVTIGCVRCSHYQEHGNPPRIGSGSSAGRSNAVALVMVGLRRITFLLTAGLFRRSNQPFFHVVIVRLCAYTKLSRLHPRHRQPM